MHRNNQIKMRKSQRIRMKYSLKCDFQIAVLGIDLGRE